MSIESDVKKWLRSVEPTNWLNQCAGLTMSICRHFGYAPPVGGHAYPTATAAYEAAKIESTNPTKAPPGAIHYWSYTTTIGGRRLNFGHVAPDIRGGGTHVLSATSNASPMWGTNAGLISVDRQTQLIGSAGRYLGWSRFYGKSYYADLTEPDSHPSPEPSPTPIPTRKDTLMLIVYVKAKGATEVYALHLAAGTRRHVPAAEWAAIKTAHAAAGVKVPYSNGKVTAAQLKTIPEA